MTIEQHFFKWLTDRGMWEKDATEVMKLVKATHPEMEHRWNDQRDGYPPQLFAVVALSVRQAAQRWIANHTPEAWYREMFEPPPG